MKIFAERLIICLLIAVISGVFACCYAENAFSAAMRTCENYTKQGSASYESEVFDITITLQKKNDKCIYKEKISQDKKYQLLTCEFQKHQWAPIADSMEKFNNTFKKEIAKNSIFEAKLTTNGEVFQKYLADPYLCKITHSKQ